MGLDDYQIERELGRGAMGVVYAGVHKLLGRRVAIKVLAGERDAEGVERFLREGRAVAAISHPNVVVIPGASSVDQLRHNVEAADLDLKDGEIEELTAESESFEPLGKPATAREYVRAMRNRD